MLKRKIMSAILSISAIGIASSAYATPFTLTNNSDAYVTSILNGGPCSNIFGDTGVTRPHTISTIDEMTLKLGCIANSEHCKVEVYPTNNCTGKSIGIVDFSTTHGVNSVTNYENSGYHISGSGFQATLS